MNYHLEEFVLYFSIHIVIGDNLQKSYSTSSFNSFGFSSLVMYGAGDCI